jgi:hypothetical protein
VGMTSPVFLLTPPPRVVTARITPVSRCHLPRLGQGVADLDLRLANGVRDSGFDEFALAQIQEGSALDQRGIQLR